MKTIDFSKNGGLPLSQDRLAYMQTAYTEAVQALAKLAGDKTITSGCIVTGSNISDGWIVYNGELIRFVGGNLAANVAISTTGTGLVFKNGINNTVLNEKTASCALIGTFPYSDLVRLPDLKTTYMAIASLTSSIIALGERIDNLAWGDISGKPSSYINYSAKVYLGDVGNPASSAINNNDSKWTITIPDQGINDYIVAGSLVGNHTNMDLDNDVMWITGGYTRTTFDICIREVSGVVQDLSFAFAIIKTI